LWNFRKLNSYNLEIEKTKEIHAWWFGGLATAKAGDDLEINGKKIKSSKSDVVIRIVNGNGKEKFVGVSIKDCNTKSPTNDQVHFTTARAFCKLLRDNGISVSENIEVALRKFCGDIGYRPQDILSKKELVERKSTPERFFLEEIGEEELKEITDLFSNNQRKITKIILKYAYAGDLFPPDFILHKTTNVTDDFGATVAIHSMEELLNLSEKFSHFVLKSYKIRKGSWKNDPHTHLAPQLGFIQMQRKGSKKNATQLQFNLKAGYFNFEPQPSNSNLIDY